MNRRGLRGLVVVALIGVGVSRCALFDALDGDDGPPQNRLIWKVDGAPRGRPATDGDQVFFVDASHRVIAVDASSGRTRWTSRADSGAVEQVPTFAGCTVGGSVVACGDNGDLVAFRRTDGAFAWRFHPSIGRLVDLYPFTVVDSTFYTGSRNGAALHAIDVNSGIARWSAMVPGLAADGAVRDPAADTGLVVAAYWRLGKPTTGGVIAVDARTGAIRWNTPLPQILPDSDSSGGYAILWRDLVIASSNSGRIFGIDRASGAIRWNAPGVGRDPPSAFGGRPVIFDYRALVIRDDRLFASSMYGWLIAYDPRTGTELWRVDPETSDGNGNPIHADATSVYVTYLTGRVVSFATTDGRVRAIANKTDLLASIALGSDRFYAPGDHGLYAYAKR